MNNEQNDINVKDEELSQVNGGVRVKVIYFCNNPDCKNYEVELLCPGSCKDCGQPLDSVVKKEHTVIVR